MKLAKAARDLVIESIGGVTVFLIFLFFVPIASAVVLGADEGLEFSKALLFARDSNMANTMWNDQPFLYTWVSGILIRCFGAHAWIARALTICATVAMLLSMNRLMPGGARLLEKTLCTLMFLSWSEIPELTVSAMIELPAFSLAVLSASLSRSAVHPTRWWRVAMSGVLFATALHVKLTAAIALPALMGEMLLYRDHRLLRPAVWTAFATATFISLICVMPAWSLESLWYSHLEAGRSAVATTDQTLAFHPLELFQNAATVLSAGLGFWYLSRSKRWRDVVFPGVLLLSVGCVHLIHRPWWWYYNVHFAVPFAIVGSWALGYLIRASISTSNLLSSEANAFNSVPVAIQRRLSSGTAALLAAAIISLWFGFQLADTMREIRELDAGEKVANSAILSKMREYSAHTQWAYARGSAQPYLFHANLIIPPEITVLPKKRFWNERITEKDVFDIVNAYKPEQLLLVILPKERDDSWKQLLAKEYVLVHYTQSFELYVSKRLHPKPFPSQEALLRRLGL
jgi:hypothetical protein